MITNNITVAIFYGKRLYSSLLSRSVEGTSLCWLGISGSDATCLNQLSDSDLLFAIVSGEFLEQGANKLIQDIRAMHATVQIILCYVEPTVPPASILRPLLTTADPDFFCHISELTACLQTLMMGRSFVSTHMWVDTNERPNAEPTLTGWADLSKQERNIIHLMAEGYKVPDIASKLFISSHTVNNHKANIIQKLSISGGPGCLIQFVMTNREKILSRV